MKPNKPGIWEWFEEDGTKRLVRVCDVGVALGKQHLRVAWWGGYYDVHDRIEDIYGYRDHQWGVVEKDSHHKAEWPDRWGKYIGPPESVMQADLYDMPTPEQRTEIIKNYKEKN